MGPAGARSEALRGYKFRGNSESMAQSQADTSKRWAGASVPRVEDYRLLTGTATFLADIQLPGLLDVAFVRSPYARAKINGLDLTAARSVPGVVAAVGAEDLKGLTRSLRAESSLRDYQVTEQPLLAGDEVRYVGDAVAAVVAAGRYEAEDAAEAVMADYEPLEAVADPVAAMQQGAPRVHSDTAGNTLVSRVFHSGEPEAALSSAFGVIREEFRTARVLAAPMEARGCVAKYDPGTGVLTLWYSTQIAHIARTGLAWALGLPEHRIRVITPDVGGGFGSKSNLQPEEIVTAHLAIRLRRPVRWVEDRLENMLASTHARDHRYWVEAAYTAGGVVTALKARLVADLGAYSVFPWTGALEPGMAGGLLTGPYRIDNYHCEVFGVTTNKCPVGAFRGVARPSTVFVMEGVLDRVARATGLDPAEVRRRNLIRPEDFPYKMPTRVVQDRASHLEAFETALSLADYAGVRAEQQRLRSQGRYIGIGMASFAELTGLGSKTPVAPGAPLRSGYECATVRMDPGGGVTVYCGASAMGQGLETSLTQLAADELGVPLESVRVTLGDTELTPYGMGSYASRGAVLGGGVVVKAARRVREKLLVIAAHLLGARAEEMEIRDGRAQVQGAPERSLSLAEVAVAAYWECHRLPTGVPAGLDATEFFDPVYGTTANGTHLAVVEVLPSTGEYKILRYLVVDDCGRMINPVIVEGQIVGAVAQGIGGAGYERVAYDENGQMLTATFVDYLLPTAMEVPHIEVHHLQTPAATETGVKGVGEGGTVPPNAAIAGALADAIPGAWFTETPITSEAVHTALCHYLPGHRR